MSIIHITYPCIFVHWKPNRIINLYNLINGINVISPVHLPVAHLQITSLHLTYGACNFQGLINLVGLNEI